MTRLDLAPKRGTRSGQDCWVYLQNIATEVARFKMIGLHKDL